MSMSIKVANGKLVYDVKIMMLNAHANSKATAEYKGISYIEAFAFMLKQEWAVAKADMSRTSLNEAGEMRITINPYGKEKQVNELRNAW